MKAKLKDGDIIISLHELANAMTDAANHLADAMVELHKARDLL